jgi:dephospho-CoA kinase
MLVIAVTGSMGAGKSSAAARLAEQHDAVVIDLDAMARGLVTDPGPVRDRVVEAFGPGVLGAGGEVDTARLASAAFADAGSCSRLNSIVHPAVTRAVGAALDGLALRAVPPTAVVIDVPLLVEVPELRGLADLVVSVEAPEGVRLARLRARGVDEADARRRMSLQSTPEARAAIADTVIFNDGEPAALDAAIDAFWECEVSPRVA